MLMRGLREGAFLARAVLRAQVGLARVSVDPGAELVMNPFAHIGAAGASPGLKTGVRGFEFPVAGVKPEIMPGTPEKTHLFPLERAAMLCRQ